MVKRKSRKRRGRTKVLPFLAVILFLFGAGIFLYPTVSNYFAEQRQASVVEDYQEKVDETDEAELEAEWEKAEVYNQNLTGDPVRDPFIEGSGYVLPQNYQEVLNVDGVMGYVEIPKINVLLPIYHGSSEEVLENGAGHIEANALPIGGNGRHAVLTGHRGIPGAELFTRLDEMEIGDIFFIHVLGRTLAYEVDQIKTVLPTELDDIQPVQGRDLVTLLTCTPYGVNTHRLLVRGSRTEYVPQDENASGGAGTEDAQPGGFHFKLSADGILLGAVLTAGIAVLCVVWRRRRHGR